MSRLFLAVLEMSITASYVIAALCIARFLLQMMRSPKWVSYALWAVAGLRLSVPFAFKSSLSLIPQGIPQGSFITQEAPLGQYAVSKASEALNSASLAVPRDFYPIFAWAWLLGAAIMAIYAAASYARLVLYKDRVEEPFVYGFLKPKIHIPKMLSEDGLRYVMLHEKIHIERRDYLLKIFAFMLLCAHWFNPMVWLAFALFSEDMEMSCDERALKSLGAEAKAGYSEMILSISSGNRHLKAMPLGFGGSSVIGRVKNVLGHNKRPKAVIISAVALLAVLTVGFSLDAAGVKKANFSSIAIDGHVIGQGSYGPIRIELGGNGIGDMAVFLAHSENTRGEPTIINKSAQNATTIDQIEALLGKGKVDRLKIDGKAAFTERYTNEDGITVWFAYSEGKLLWVEAITPNNRLANLRTPYIGDNSAVGKIIYEMPMLSTGYKQEFFSIGDDYGTGFKPYTLTVYFQREGKAASEAASKQNAVILLALIGNLEEVSFAERLTPGGGELDESAYQRIATYSRASLNEYLRENGLDWKSFDDDWGKSFGKVLGLKSE